MSVKKALFANSLFLKLYGYIKTKQFKGTSPYWEHRYLSGGNSGNGSYGLLAEYKANFLNEFVEQNKINSVLELGCGDGNQLLKAVYPSYIGYDISHAAIAKCSEHFKNDHSKKFYHYDAKIFNEKQNLLFSELALSLDVIYHLVQKDEYENYMNHLFNASSLYIIIYAWDVEIKQNIHVKHRKFSTWIKENKNEWTLIKHTTENKPTEACDFFIYKKTLPSPLP